MSSPRPKRPKQAHDVCQLCRSAVEPTATLLCCDACLDRIVEAEDAGGSWRSSYLFPHRLVDAEGEQMLRLVSSLLPQGHALAVEPGLRRDGTGTHATEPPPEPPPSGVAAAAAALRGAERLLLLLGSGASASYGVPVNLTVSEHAGQLARYGPVRRAALAAPVGGTYAVLRRLLVALGHGPQPPTDGSSAASRSGPGSGSGSGSGTGTGRGNGCGTACVVSTNIDGLALREGLPELQLHGTAPCREQVGHRQGSDGMAPSWLRRRQENAPAQAAPGSGQPRPISRVCRDGRPHRARVRHWRDRAAAVS